MEELRLPDFLQIPSILINDKELHQNDWLVYGVIYWYTKLKLQKCILSNQKIALLIRSSKASVGNSLSRLSRGGYIKIILDDKNHRTEIIPLVYHQKEANPITNKTAPLNPQVNPPSPVGEPPLNPQVNIIREDIIREDNKNQNLVAKATGTEFNNLLYEFRNVNPSYQKLFENKTERKALQEMVDRYGFDKMTRLLEQLPEIITKPYAPRITTPYILQKKMGELVVFIEQERRKNGTNNKKAVDARHL